LHLGVTGEGLCFLNAAVNDCDHAQGIGGAGRRVSTLEEVGHELLNALRAGRLRERRIACLRHPHSEEGDQSDDHRQDYRGGRHRSSVAADELGGPVAQCVWSRFQGLTFEVMVNIPHQRFH
jgi:hypothetical protein